jgi:acyl-CoA synthetase (AMP-forming)/AMP-acid ligase II
VPVQTDKVLSDSDAGVSLKTGREPSPDAGSISGPEREHRGQGPRAETLGELLEDKARTHRDEVAIAAPGRRPMTYGRLFHHVERTVEVLRAIGLKRNDRVAMVLPNGPEMAVGFVAVATAATCAPLNPAYGRVNSSSTCPTSARRRC